MQRRILSRMLLVIGLLTAVGPVASTAIAQDTGDVAAYADGEDLDASRLGALSAMACGIMVRGTIATGGAIVGIIAPTVAICVFAALCALAE